MPYTQIGPNGWPQFRQQTSDAEWYLTSGLPREEELYPHNTRRWLTQETAFGIKELQTSVKIMK